MMKPKMTLACFSGQPGSAKLGKLLSSPQPCKSVIDTQGKGWTRVVLMRKRRQAYIFRLCGKKAGPGRLSGLEKQQFLTLINDLVEKNKERTAD